MTHPNARRLAVGLTPLVALAAAVVLALTAFAPRADAASNLSNLDCRGHVEKGEAGLFDDPDSTQVKYAFACSGPITGYSIVLPSGVSAFDTDVSVSDRVSGEPVVSDSFTCNGDIPGIGFNCTGTYSGNYNKVIAQFSIDQPLDQKPLIDPVLVVTTATVSGGQPVTAISGPFDLGHPHGLTKKKKRAASAKKSAAKKAAKKAAAKRR